MKRSHSLSPFTRMPLTRILCHLFLVTALAACGGGSSGGGDTSRLQPGIPVTLSGTASYDLVPHGTGSGLDYDSIEIRPIRGAEVLLLDADNRELDSTITDAEGRYEFNTTSNLRVRVRVNARYSSNGTSSGAAFWDFLVTDNTSGNAPYAMQGALLSTGSANSVRDLHAASGWTGSSYTEARSAAPFAILDTVYDAIQMMLAVDNTFVFSSTELRWSVNNTPALGDIEEGDIGGSYYDSFEGNLYLLGAADSDADEYDIHVVAHEWCHAFEDKISRSDSIGGPHGFGDRLDMRVAWSEGLCNAFSAMVTGDPVYKDSSGFNQQFGFQFDLEDNLTLNTGWYNEDSVGSIVYDIFDSTNDGPDSLSDGFGSIYETLSSSTFTSSDALTSIHMFADLFQSQHPSLSAQLEDLLDFQDITVNDAFGTGETNDAGDARVLPIYSSLTVGPTPTTVCSIDDFGLINKLGNGQFLRIVLGFGDADLYTIEATRSSGALNTDPDILVFEDGDVVASAESIDVNTESLTLAMFPGTYILEIYDAYNAIFEEGQDVCFDVTVVPN